MPTLKHTFALALAGLLTAPAAALAAAPADVYVPGEVVVGKASGAVRVVQLPPDASVAAATARLERRPGVRFAAPNWVARTAATPLDQGATTTPGGWRDSQWNFLSAPGGIRVAPAWNRLHARTGPFGAAATTVAVVDTGIAYAEGQRVAAAPDFAPTQFAAGYDFVDEDTTPLDTNGHGTHVAATIGEAQTLETPSPEPDYLTGIAPGVRLMPVRVLDAKGQGSAEDVAQGILWAARNGADVINVSLQFAPIVRGCSDVPTVCEAAREARRGGALVIAAAGNADESKGQAQALMPGGAPGVLGVGATTEDGCLASYSHYGKRTDLFAPGGGPARPSTASKRCAGDSRAIEQLTFACFPICSERLDRFAIRPDLGTSMAAAHASGVAALIHTLAAGGPISKPARMAKRLICTARRTPGARLFGDGVLDAARATGGRRC